MLNPRLIILLIVLIFPGGLSSAQQLQATLVSDGILVREGVDSVLLFVTRTKSLDGKYARSDYIHPLWGFGGNRLTLDFPDDHPHHRGVFWAWRRISVTGKYAGDSWVIKEFSWDIKEVKINRQGDSLLVIIAKTYWFTGERMNEKGIRRPFVEENIRIFIHKKQVHFRIIDIEIGLRALMKAVAVAGYDNESELSGFSIRIKTPDDLMFETLTGRVKPQWPAMKAGPWVDMSGTMKPGCDRSGLAILTNKDNPTPKDTWNLRQKDSMQNVVFPGRNPYILPTDDFLFLKYRLLIHDDKMHISDIQRLYESFNK